MLIYIPSTGRADQLNTLRNLPPALLPNTVVVVYQKEFKEYSRIVAGCGACIITRPLEVKGIGATRQWIIEQAHFKNEKKLVMMDDDLGFCTRRQDDLGKFLPSTNKEIINLVDDISISLNTFSHVGVLGREGGNRIHEEYITCSRMTRILAYNTETFIKEKIDFTRNPPMEDFDVTLQLLRKGYPNKIICWAIQGQGNSQAAGGISGWRTPARHAMAAERLAKFHKPFVKVVEKTTKTAWGGGTRKDVIVQWKKAYLSSGKELP